MQNPSQKQSAFDRKMSVERLAGSPTDADSLRKTNLDSRGSNHSVVVPPNTAAFKLLQSSHPLSMKLFILLQNPRHANPLPAILRRSERLKDRFRSDKGML